MMRPLSLTKPITTILLAAAFSGAAFGQAIAEEKLADKIIKANRAVAHAQAKATASGQALDAYCRTKEQRAGVRPNDGNWGCVTPEAPASVANQKVPKTSPAEAEKQ